MTCSGSMPDRHPKETCPSRRETFKSPWNTDRSSDITVLETISPSPLYVTICNATMSNEAAIHDPSELGDLERELLALLWQAGDATADLLRVKLGRPLQDSTIRTVLRRLDQTAHLTHPVDQR